LREKKKGKEAVLGNNNMKLREKGETWLEKRGFRFRTKKEREL
jgi:hypothetical protein